MEDVYFSNMTLSRLPKAIVGQKCITTVVVKKLPLSSCNPRTPKYRKRGFSDI